MPTPETTIQSRPIDGASIRATGSPGAGGSVVGGGGGVVGAAVVVVPGTVVVGATVVDTVVVGAAATATANSRSRRFCAWRVWMPVPQSW